MLILQILKDCDINEGGENIAIKKSESKEKKKAKEQEEEVKPEARITFGIEKNAFLNVLDLVACLVDEFPMEFSSEGMKITLVDPAHVAMMAFEIPSDYFDGYAFKATVDEYKIGVSVTKLKDFLKLLSGSEKMMLGYDSSDKQFVLQAGRIKRKMAEIDTTSFPNPKVPGLNLPTEVTITNSQLTTALTAVAQVTDHIKVLANGKSKKNIMFVGEGDTDNVELELTKDDGAEVSGDDIKSLFPLDYLTSFSKAIGSKTKLEMHMGSDYPVKIEFEVESGSKKASVTYLLAPRIEAD